MSLTNIQRDFREIIPGDFKNGRYASRLVLCEGGFQEGRKRAEKTAVRFVDESDRGQIRRFLVGPNQPGAVVLVTQG
jgi:hypothetical protein